MTEIYIHVCCFCHVSFFFISSTIFTLTLSRHCKSADLMPLATQSKGKNVVAEEQINVLASSESRSQSYREHWESNRRSMPANPKNHKELRKLKTNRARSLHYFTENLSILVKNTKEYLRNSS